MKNWEFLRVDGNRIMIDDRLSDMMGLVDGGFVYSTLFGYNDNGPKRYELILSMYPQENYRTLTSITMYMQDVPGASAQAAKFLSSRGINILNSLSLDGMSDTTIIWRILADLSFVGEMDILREKFDEAKRNSDPSVSLLSHVEIKPADVGRVFRTEPSKKKTEIRRAAPVTFKDGTYDLSVEYGDILNDVDGQNVLLLTDLSSWMVSVTFFKKETKLVKMELEIPDCPGSLCQALEWIASANINLISVFSKVKISYQTTTLELVADFSNSRYTVGEFRRKMAEALTGFNGIFELKGFEEFN